MGNLYWKNINGEYLGCNKAYADLIGLKCPRKIIVRTDIDLFSSQISIKQLEDLMKGDQLIMQSNSERVFTKYGIDAQGKSAI